MNPSTRPRRRTLWLPLVCLQALIVLLYGTALSRPDVAAAGPATAPGPLQQIGVEGGLPLDAQVEALLAAMTLEQKVGQLFMVHGYGASVRHPASDDIEANRSLHGLDDLAQLMETYQPGGFVYFNFTRNVESPRQLAELSNDLQRLATATGAGIPLLIGIDQEHGMIRRIGPPATELPGTMALGAIGSTVDAYTAAYLTGVELRSMGIHVNFAPVADVNVNPANPIIGIRSFGDDPESVSRLVAAQVRGFRDAGVVATAKHFPGHGDTHVDSHTGLPLIDRSRELFATVDLPPFQAAIDAGVDLIMSAHIVVPALDDSGRPATLSRTVMTGLLREEMGFEGLIVTDALTMDGVRQGIEPGQIAVEALKAGVDILLMPEDLAVAYEAVLAAVRSGELSEARIDASVRRILQLKAELGLFADAEVEEGRVDGVVGAPAHRAIAAQLAERSITLVQEGVAAWPPSSGGGGEVGLLVAGWDDQPVRDVGTLFLERGFRVLTESTGVNPGQGEIERLVERAADHDFAVILTSNGHQTGRAGQVELIRRLAEEGIPVIVLGTGLPYEAALLPDEVMYLALYGFRLVSLEAAVKVLTGEVAPVGRLPVSIPTVHGEN